MLKKQIAVLNELLNLLGKENSALKKSDANALLEIVKLKEKVVKDLSEIEAKRFELMGDITLSQYVETHHVEDGLVQEYAMVMAKINHYQSLNQHLATLTYDYSQDMLGALQTSAKEKSITYGRQGNMYSGSEVKTTMMNRKV